MYGVGVRHLLGYNYTKAYSPLTLNNEWPSLWRLIFIICFTTVGTTINGFFISSFFIENPLRKLGNVFLGCVGLADLLITTGVMPAAAVVLLSGVWEVPEVCYTMQFLTQASTYTYSLLFAMVAIETYTRLCRTRACYEKFLNLPISCLAAMIFLISFATSGVGVYLSMDYDYCTRETYGNYTFRLITSLLLHGIPFAITMVLLISTSLIVRARAIRLIHYKRSQQFERDYSFTNLNLGCYMLYVLAWIPYLIIVHRYPNTPDSTYYNCVWLGLSRSIVTSFLYSGLNRNFRRAFSHLFYYCCCKSSLNVPYNNRHRRTSENKPANFDVRVHIMHQTRGLNVQRAGVGDAKVIHRLEM